jgi:hypothetical protein
VSSAGLAVPSGGATGGWAGSRLHATCVQRQPCSVQQTTYAGVQCAACRRQHMQACSMQETTYAGVQHAGDNICSVQHAGDNICSVQHAGDNICSVQHAGDNICGVQHAGDNICGVQHAGDNICSVQHARATHRSGTSDSTGCVLTARSATSSSQRWCDDSCAATHAHVHSRTPHAPARPPARPPCRPPAPICAAIAALSTSEGTPNRMGPVDSHR